MLNLYTVSTEYLNKSVFSYHRREKIDILFLISYSTTTCALSTPKYYTNHKLTMTTVAMKKQFLIGQLSLPDPNYLNQVTSDSRKFMREHVLVLISGMRCDEEVDPLTYATGTTQSYRFYKNYQTKKETSPTYIHSDVCACCGNYRVYNGCKNSMCNCTNSYQEWNEYDHDNEIERNEHEEFQNWYDAIMEEEWEEESRREDRLLQYRDDYDLYMMNP